MELSARSNVKSTVSPVLIVNSSVETPFTNLISLALCCAVSKSVASYDASVFPTSLAANAVTGIILRASTSDRDITESFFMVRSFQKRY